MNDKQKMIRWGLLVSTALLAYVVFLKWLLWEPYSYDHIDWPGKEHRMQRMKYHGTDYCIEGSRGCYFIREGKRVWI